MNRNTFFAMVLLASAALSAPAWAADPTLHEVYQAAEAGHLDQAETMMQQVLRDHPDSAKAHFVEAELLARGGHVDAARGELATAERLAPGLSFAKPASVSALRERLTGSVGSTAPMAAPAVHAAAGTSFSWMPWVLGLLVVALIIKIVRGMTPPRAIPAPMAGGPAPGYGGYGQPYGGPGMGPMGGGGGMGSGILGGLATGAAVGAGLVAGESLMHHVLDGSGRERESGFIPDANAGSMPDRSDDLGGSDFGVSDGGSWDNSSGGSDLGGGDW